MMKNYLYRLLVIGGVLFTSSCVKETLTEQKNSVDNDPVIIHDTIYMSQEEWDRFSEDLLKRKDSSVIEYDTMYMAKEEWTKAKSGKKEVEVEKQKLGENPVASIKTTDFTEVRKYNVVVASLAKEEGVKRLKAAFDQAGIKHIVVKNKTGGLSHFVIYSSDTREEAVAARKRLMDEYANKSTSDVWKQFGITMKDSYIWEKK